MSDDAAVQPVDADGADDPQELRVSWAELFFDLVFVFAVTQVSTLLRQHHALLGIAQAVVVFVPVYWTWVGTSIHVNTHGVERAVDRLGVFAVGLGGLLMAVALPGAYGPGGVLFGASYWVARLLLLALVRQRGRGRFDPTPFLAGAVGTGPLLLIGGLLPDPARIAVWAVAAGVDLLTPRLIRRRILGVQFEPSHLAERYGLFVIIALGESVVAIGAPSALAVRLNAGVVVVVAVAFALVAGLWWVYFVFAVDAVAYALRTARIQVDVVRQVLSYGHLAFLAGIIAMAVGTTAVIADPQRPLTGDMAGLLFGGCALYLGAFGYTRWHMFRKWSTTRLGAAAVILLLLPVATSLPALAALALLAALVVALNVLERWLVRLTRH